MIYQIIGILVGILAIIVTFLRFKDGRMSLGMLVVWTVIWLVLIAVSIYPELTSFFAQLTGIGRGLDLFLIIGLIGCYYLIFKIYNMIESLEENITQLVQELALQKEKSDNMDDSGNEGLVNDASQ